MDVDLAGMSIRHRAKSSGRRMLCLMKLQRFAGQGDYVWLPQAKTRYLECLFQRLRSDFYWRFPLSSARPDGLPCRSHIRQVYVPAKADPVHPLELRLPFRSIWTGLARFGESNRVPDRLC